MTKVIKSSKFKDSNGNLSKTYVIKKPGIYHLCGSVDFVPIAEGQSAIQILSDDVVLDLCGHILQQANNIQNVTGIRLGVEDGLQVFKNITVKNGTIKFSGQGIAAFNAAILTDPTKVFDNLTFSELNLSECGSESTPNYASGINLSSPIVIDILEKVTTFAFTNVTIENCKVNNCQGNGAISVLTCDGLIVRDTQVNGISTPSSTGAFVIEGRLTFQKVGGVQVFGNNLQLTNVQVNSTLFRGTEIDLNFGVFGILSISSTNLVLANCSANNTTSENDVFETGGLQLLSSDNITIDTCQFNASTSLGTSATLNSIANCQNVSVKDTTFNDSFSSASYAAGLNADGVFYFEGLQDICTNNHYFLNCQFNNSSTDSFAGACTQNTIWENCQFNNNLSQFHISDLGGTNLTTNGLKWINCQFNGNTGSIFIITAQNLVFENCQVTNSASGFQIGSLLDPVSGPRTGVNGELQNITFKNCVISDIQGHGEAIAINIFNTTENNQNGRQGTQANIVVQNCIIERIHSTSNVDIVAGINIFPSSNFLYSSGNSPAQNSRMLNLSITDCRISDVKAGQCNPVSAGILLQSVENPVLTRNSISDCDRGILFTGTNDITSNIFQVAATPGDALALDFIDISTGNVIALPNVYPFNPPNDGYTAGPNSYGDVINANRYLKSEYAGQTIGTVQFGLFNLPEYRTGSKVYNLKFQLYASDASGLPAALPTFESPLVLVSSIPFVASATPEAPETAIYDVAFNYVINDLPQESEYFFIAVDWSEAYNFPTLTDAYLVGVFLTAGSFPVPDSRAFAGGPFVEIIIPGAFWGDYPRYWNILGDLWINPTMISSGPINNALGVPYKYQDVSAQTFTNVTRGNTISVDQVLGEINFIAPEIGTDLTALGWQTGDQLTYQCNNTNTITGLACTDEFDQPSTYYAIVYKPGFTRRGLVQENKVTNCSVSGYQDDYVDSQDELDVATRSGWINNVALLNGENYAITWANGTPQVDEGTLGEYPLSEHKYWNLSITQ